jgi:hypothetical protein
MMASIRSRYFVPGIDAANRRCAREQKRLRGFARIFSAHVRSSERGAPVQREGLGSLIQARS